MVDSTKKINSFEDLRVWQDALEFAVSIYKLSDDFPKSEQFGITNQLRRASTSVSANIAEGFGRKSQKEKIQFYSISYGSLLESKNFLHLSNKLGFIDDTDCENLLNTALGLQKQLNALMSSIKHS